MEESGGTSAAQQHEPGDPPDDGAGRGLVALAAVILIALVGLLAFLAGRDDEGDAVRRFDERFPATSTTGAVTTVETTIAEAASTAPTAPPSTEAAVTATTVAPTTAGEPATAGEPTTAGVPTTVGATTTTIVVAAIGDVVPNLAAFAELLATPTEAQPQIDQLLATGRHDVAVRGPVLSLCASVGLRAPLDAGGRWERDGREVSSSVPIGRAPPGFGECLSDSGTALPDGSYQYIAVDTDGNESAAGGLVVGAARVDQRFTNNGTEPLCAMRIAPADSRYFEVYVYDAAPIAPGAFVTLPIADVDQDVEAVACGTREIVAGFDFHPQPGEVQPLVP